MNIADELAKLEGLRQSGALTAAEFTAAKAMVLGGATADQARRDSQYEGDRVEMPGGFLHRIRRSRTDYWLGGVCGGLGQATEIPSWGWRLLYVLAFFCGGIGIIPYILMWIFIPREPGN
jgi:phage shock protein C